MADLDYFFLHRGRDFPPSYNISKFLAYYRIYVKDSRFHNQTIEIHYVDVAKKLMSSAFSDFIKG